MERIMPTDKAIHIAKSLKANRTSQNLAINMSLPTLKKMLTKLKRIEEMKKALGPTKAIRNPAKRAGLRIAQPLCPMHERGKLRMKENLLA